MPESFTIRDFDEAHADHRNFLACEAHLEDLQRVYGRPPARIQPISYGRRGPCLPSAHFPDGYGQVSTFLGY
jgi:hypothetical protein